MKVETVGVIGLGFVGTAVQKGFESTHKVVTYDIQKDCTEKSITDVVKTAQVTFICVPTPMNSDGTCNTSIVESVLTEIASVNDMKSVCVLKSTIPPGTTNRLAEMFPNITIAFNPEFLTEKNYINDFLSQVILSSVVFGYAQQNVTKRTGYMDDRDGIYFEQVGSNTSNGTNNGTLNFVIRSFTTGTALESDVGSYKRRVPQSQWSVDPCDGTGPSGFNIDTSKTQLVYIDFQWLGVGRVRVGFVHDGAFIIAHEYYHSNILNEVYLSSPNLPVRCEIRNTGTTSGGSMGQICASVISEGGYNESGIDWSTFGYARTTATPSATPLPLIALRLKTTFKGYPNRLSVRLNTLSLYAETNSIIFEIIKLPNASSLANGTGALVWTSADDDSGCEYCVNADSYTSANADRLASGFVPSGSSQNSLSPVSTGSITAAKKNIIVQNYDSSESEVYAVIVRTIITAGNQSASVAAALQWREIY